MIDRNDLSVGNDVAKTNNSKECIVRQYWYFNHGFKFQKSVCNCCHDLLMLCLNMSIIAIIPVKGADYHYYSVGKEVTKNTKFSKLNMKVNKLENKTIDASTLLHTNQYNKDKLDLVKK